MKTFHEHITEAPRIGLGNMCEEDRLTFEPDRTL